MKYTWRNLGASLGIGLRLPIKENTCPCTWNDRFHPGTVVSMHPKPAGGAISIDEEWMPADL